MTTKKPFQILLAAAILLTHTTRIHAQPVKGWEPIPTLENLQTGLLEMLDHLHLTHVQHEQVERILSNETMQLSLARWNADFSVSKIFSHEQAIRIQARRQIEEILTPRQKERIAKRMIHEMEEHERWGEEKDGVFSLPATY